jgi:hypothetical protein
VPDAEALAAIARQWTGTPEDCWFCVWDGFGWPGHSVSADLRGRAARAHRRDPRLRPPGGLRSGELRIQATGRRDYSSDSRNILRDTGELRDDLTFYLTFAVLELAGM